MLFSIRGVINEVSDVIVHGAASGALGYFLSRSLSLMGDPVSGGVLCAISSLVSRFVYPVFNAIFIGDPRETNDSSFVLGNVLSIVSGTAISAAIATRLGYPVALYTGMMLTASILTAGLVAALAVTILGACLRGDAYSQSESS